MKRCSKCHISKPKNEFYKDKHASDGLTYACKKCQKEYQASRYKKDRDKILRKQNSKYKPRKKKSRICLTCKEEYKGSANQKYCSAYCRNTSPKNKKRRKQSYIKNKGSYEFVCNGCGKVSYATAKNRMNYCTHECYVENRPKEWNKYQAQCLTCGENFGTTASKAKYCCNECNPSTWDRCSVNFVNCANCEELFTSSHSGKMYCSDKCHNTARSIKYWESQPKKHCRYCEKIFQPMYKKSKHFCSKDCRSKHKRQISSYRDDHRSRAKYYGVYYERVLRRKVFKRDGYICQECGIKTHKKLVGKNSNKDKEPTLDHIIPMSRGGPHSYNNVQTLCRKCNTNKNNRLQGQGVLLFNSIPRPVKEII